MDTTLMSKYQLLDQLEDLKLAWENEFIDSIEFSKDEIERWLVRYNNKNDDIDDTLHQLGIYLREMENEMFEIKTKHEIMVAPMREYIEEWLRKSLINITETDQHEVVTTVMPPLVQHLSTKEASTRSNDFKKISITVSQVATLFSSLPSFSSTIICHISFFCSQ
jgi:hypothetical protein